MTDEPPDSVFPSEDDPANEFLSEDEVCLSAPHVEVLSADEPCEFLPEGDVQEGEIISEAAPSIVLRKRRAPSALAWAAMLSGVWVGASAALYLLSPHDATELTVERPVVDPTPPTSPAPADIRATVAIDAIPASPSLSSEESPRDVAAMAQPKPASGPKGPPYWTRFIETSGSALRRFIDIEGE